jgi:hypothetical protein
VGKGALFAPCPRWNVAAIGGITAWARFALPTLRIVDPILSEKSMTFR